MTKKDYERAATIVQDFAKGFAEGSNDSRVLCARHILSAFFSDDNPRFDESRFRAACIPGANVKARPHKPKTVN